MYCVFTFNMETCMCNVEENLYCDTVYRSIYLYIVQIALNPLGYKYNFLPTKNAKKQKILIIAHIFI